MFLLPQIISARRLQNITIMWSAADALFGNPVLALTPADVTVNFTKPGSAPAGLPISVSNFRELGQGLYEYDLAGTNLDVDGMYAIDFSGILFFGLTIPVVVSFGAERILQILAGFGTVVLSEIYGGTIPDPEPLKIVSGGVPLAGVRFYLFLETDYDAGYRDIAAYAKGIGESDQYGKWKWPILVEPGDYVLVADVTSQPLYELVEVKRFVAANPIPSPQPLITLASPSTGPAAGGTLVTIIGTDFADGCTVKFGATLSGSVSFIGSTMIKAIAPVHAIGAVDVIVTNPDFQYGRLAAGYTYT